ncbi:MAG: bifunctional (p)ppGpp synthetase/guanosine-3',5'-bis(diphosphate) 3'-pyrophosphohydrolase [Acidobacteria bacterium]|nr:bifunctional (p)ppGpp synthetase/guanosine-3',5'-bis(diphosphate) 3'-pyrophosphohydrolase [Acidobacteriota bacterium]
MIRFEDLLEKVRTYSPEGDLELLRKAYVFSALAHKGQVRHSGEPYLIHPLEVSDILADQRLDVVCVASGLLHDVIEDTLATVERISELFGSDIAHIVEGLTKISAIEFSSSEERQAENFRKMLLAMVDDIRVIFVKLADRLHNMRTLEFMPEEKRPRVAQETLDIYAPIAGRLGMSKMKNELEELAFMHLEPQAYQSLRSRVDAKRAATEGVIDELTAAIRTKLAAAEVPVVAVDGRVKRLYSIWLKLRRQKIDLDQVYDFVAIRIVTPSVKDCYAALGIIHQAWSPVPGRIKDFIAMPRPNGYQSLHTSVVSDRGVPFEVQIRTEEMHHHAEDGIAAHWKYKEGRVGAARDEQYFQWMRQLLETHQDVRDSQEFLNHLKIDLYREEVYTFTPAGQVKVLPDGATPIDFAYAVHTDVGHRCVGARVNGRMVPLRTRLKNGDIIEIMTAAGHSPSRDWLGVVKTSRARSKIRQFIQTEENVRAIDVGRKLLEKEAKRFDIPKASLEEDALATAVAALGLGKVDELLAQVGYGKVAARQVLDALVPAGQLKERAPDHPVVSAVKRVLRPGAAAADRITVSGADDLMVTRARCCSPIRGEKIVGYVTRGKGVSVHAAACPNVLNLMYDPQRRIDVEWDRGGDPAPYTVRLTMLVEDRKGMLAALSASIADINTNILTLEATTREENNARIDVTIEIKDMKHLEKVIKSLRSVDGVLDIERATRR